MQQGIISVQIAALKLKQLNLGCINPGFFAVQAFSPLFILQVIKAGKVSLQKS